MPLNKILPYFKLKELSSAWIFLVFVIFAIPVFFINLPIFLAIIFSLVMLIFLIYLIMVGINMAKTNFALKLEKNQNAAIISSFSDGVIAYDQSFKIISMNQAAEIICGVRKDEVIGKIIGPEWAGNLKYKILAQIIFPSLAATVIKRTIEGWPQRVEVIIKDPKELYLEISTNQIFDENGALIGFIKVIRDKSREVEISKAKSEFITVAAHQMKTPLTGIRWAMDSLLSGSMGELNQDQKTILEQTLKSVEKMIKLIDDLLNVAKIEEGKFGYVMTKGDIITLVKEVLEDLYPFAESLGVKLILYPPTEQIPLLLFDKEKMRLALYNIVENGIRYNVKNGEVRVSFSLLKDAPYVQITIQDTGVGIPQKELSKLFTKFFRGEQAMKIETEGSGLGLYISKNIIQRHGGDITVSSIEKRGTTFKITLPTDESLIPPVETSPIEIR
jgi:PAS domain S-box-containing protein